MNIQISKSTEKEYDTRARFTYRAHEEVAVRIKALKDYHGLSFQHLTDMFYREWLYRLQNDGSMFKDLTVEKQVRHVTDDFSNMPLIRSIFKKRLD